MCHGVQEARGKSTQTTIAKARVYLLSGKLMKRGTHLFKALCNNVGDTKIEQVILKQWSKQELKGEVIDLLVCMNIGG